MQDVRASEVHKNKITENKIAKDLRRYSRYDGHVRTEEEIIERLSKVYKSSISNNIKSIIAKKILNLEKDTGLPQDLLEDDVFSYMYLVKEIKGISVTHVIDAVKYCNLKRHMPNKDAWALVFPDRYKRLKEEGKFIDSHVSMYDKTKLVQTIDREMLVPLYLQYAPYLHKAIKKEYELMNGRAFDQNGNPMKVSPHVQHLAAVALFDMVKMPEAAKIDITVSKTKEEISIQQQMAEQLAQLVKQQKARLEMGESIEDVQAIGININEAINNEEV